MMKNMIRLAAAGLAVLMLMSFAACGSKGNKDAAEANKESTAETNEETKAEAEPAVDQAEETAPEEAGDTAEFPDIVMTDTYTFTDPEDLDFDTRYVYMGDSTCKLLTDMLNFDFHGIAMYEILYSKDGEAVGEYQLFVMEDETNAQALSEFYASQGQNLTVEENRAYIYSDGDVLKGTLAMLKGAGLISSEDPETYARFIADSNGLVEQ